MIHTKIVATLGPASDSIEMIGRLVDAGVDVFRLNFSHGTLEGHARTLDHIRTACRRRGSMAAVMGDLCGPKIRIDPLEDEGIPIAPGDHIEIVRGHLVGTAQRISTNRPELVAEVDVGHRILIDDGSIQLRVSERSADRLACVCEVGGVIKPRKGINLPDSQLAMSALTEKDFEDLAWALEHELDYIALSFVRSATDLRELRERIPLANETCRIVAKIETVQAIEHLDEIIETSDVILVARGDLGVEMDIAQVPLLQKQIVAQCQHAGKPVIIATQMLQSMVEHPTATRAEVSDVANAILDAADCVMLSAETSVGAYPLESVTMMNRIAEQTERYLKGRVETARMDARLTMRRVTTAVAHGANLLARELDATLVAVWTRTGNTARLLSKTRLNVPVIDLSPDASVCRRMSIYYGVLPVLLRRRTPTSAMLREVDALLMQQGRVQPGDLIVVVADTRLEQQGATTRLLLHLVGSEADEATFPARAAGPRQES